MGLIEFMMRLFLVAGPAKGYQPVGSLLGCDGFKKEMDVEQAEAISSLLPAPASAPSFEEPVIRPMRQ
ncbi:hypothetical protein [Spirosoma horti]